MNYRNTPGSGNQYHNRHGDYRLGEGPPNKSMGSKSMGAKSSGFTLNGMLPTMPPAVAPPPGQDILPVVLPEKAADLVETTTTSKAGGFSLASLGEIKGFVDRIGGIDGILSTVSKVQKVMSSVSQMAPLVKVLMGSFKKSSASDDDDDDKEWKPKRRKRRKTGAGSKKGKGSRPTKKSKK